MSLLNRSQRQTLVDLLLRLPNVNDAAARNLLLTDLPPGLVNTIASANAPATHIAHIVNAVNDDAWARLPDGTVPLLLLIENASYMVHGSGLAAQLQAFHDAVQAALAAGGAPTASPAPPDLVSKAQAQSLNPATISLANLTGPQRKQLNDALLSAFPSAADLQQMVYFGLDVNLNQITGAGNLSAMVLDLIVWAQAQSRMEDLVKAARAANGGNALLKTFAQAAGLSA